MNPSALSNDLNEVVRDWLRAHRPAGVPATVEYRADADRAPVVRPYFVALCEDVKEESNGAIARGVLVLRMRTRAAEQEAIAAATWHQDSVKALKANFDALQLGMQARGYWLRHLWPADYDDKADGTRGRAYEQRWRFFVQTVI